MDSDDLKEAAALADRILRSYFCESDVEFLISTFAKDIVWLGSGEKMKAEGREAVAACFRSGRGDLVPCDMFDEDYIVRELGGGCCFCQGDSWIQTKSGTNTYFKTHQRITFIFRRAGDRFETVHIHNSLPYSGIGDDELFPVREAKAAHERVRSVLSQKDGQIELMLSQLPGGMQISRMDSDFSTEWISDGLCTILGYSGPEDYAVHTGNSSRGFVHPDDYDAVSHTVREALRHGDDYNLEYRVLRSDGDVLWVADFGRRVKDATGRELINSFISDISERKQQELEIEKSHREVERQARFLARLIDTVPCGILQFTTDPSHRVVNLNRMVWELHGYASEAEYRAEINTPFQLILDEDKEKIASFMDSLALDGEACAYVRESRRKDGSTIWINVIMQKLLNADGQEVIQTVFNDITEMKELQMAQEKERLIENRSLQAAICTAYPLILSINLTQDTYSCFIEEQNTYVIEQRQGTFSEMIQRLLPLVYPTCREEYETVLSPAEIRRRFAEGEKEIYLETQQMGAEGKYHWISVQIIFVNNPVGSDVLAIELVKSLDTFRAEKARQEQLLRDALASSKAANSAKSDFLSRMSHDIRTPMNAVIGMSSIGQMKADDPARVLDCFRKIDASSRFLLSLINDILDMSKIENGKMELSKEPFDITELVKDVTTIILPQSLEQQLHFDIYNHEPLERCYIGDVLRIKQILMNLLSNALKFTPPGGSVAIGVSEQRRTNGFAYLCFTVTDTGIGMSQEFLNRIFWPFEQEVQGGARNNVGSGLGLSIVYNLVLLMSGTIDVKSEKGHGTTFTVSIPLELVNDDGEKELRRKSEELLRGIEVLVVDDDATVGEQTAAILGEIGARSLWVDSGIRAVEVVKENLSQGKFFDIAMIDWRMPGMDGIETTRRIRELVGPDMTIIIISAYDWSSIESEARAAGASCFISKPLFRSVVYDAFLHLELCHGGAGDTPEPQQVFGPLGHRILLVEDNELNLEIAKTLLELHGFEVDSAENGRIAVEKFAASDPGYYLTILMDIRMPVMDGLEATRMIRSLKRADAPTIPILAMTANAFDEDRALAFEAGVTSYLVKPLDISVLITELRNLFV